MFKRISIELRGPLCNCPKQNLAWNTPAGADGKPTLRIWCKGCNVTLDIPNEQFQARFELERPYGPVETEASEKPFD